MRNVAPKKEKKDELEALRYKNNACALHGYEYNLPVENILHGVFCYSTYKKVSKKKKKILKY